MNKLNLEAQTKIIGALVEGNSVRSVERMTNVHRDTIIRLMVRVGEACAAFMDSTLRGLKCERLQLDEIWAFVGKKQRHVTADDDVTKVGDMWTFVAIDADTKLIPSYLVGKRNAANTTAFVCDLASRLENRVQISTDGLSLYRDAIEAAFGGDVDYGTIVKEYEAEAIGPGRYSPPKVVATKRAVLVGSPKLRDISTSYVERQNLTMRMQLRRLTRLTNAFSKKAENLRAAISLHFAHYNFVRLHRTLRATPAMAAGVDSRLWTLQDLVALAGW